mgnify:CR=1 FL=1|jgi:hypothetical protein|tara:strand:+ start:246 stop:482 length:237 start_codon:yes stop_codon:yes gene_type:complete
MSFIVEVGTITFDSATSGTITFSQQYGKIPTVVVTPTDDDGDGANVNCFVDSISTTSAVIRTSETFTGNIQYHVISGN